VVWGHRERDAGTGSASRGACSDSRTPPRSSATTPDTLPSIPTSPRRSRSHATKARIGAPQRTARMLRVESSASTAESAWPCALASAVRPGGALRLKILTSSPSNHEGPSGAANGGASSFGPGLAIGQLAGDPQTRLVAFDHQHQASAHPIKRRGTAAGMVPGPRYELSTIFSIGGPHRVAKLDPRVLARGSTCPVPSVTLRNKT